MPRSSRTPNPTDSAQAASLHATETSRFPLGVPDGKAEGIVVVSPVGEVQSANAAATALLDGGSADITGQRIGDLVGPAEAGGASVEAWLAGEVSKVTGERLGLRADGNPERRLTMHATPFMDAEGLAHVLILREGAEAGAIRVGLSNGVRQKQDAAKDDLIAHVSHELRAPLASTHQFLAILADGLAGDMTALQQEYVGIALRNAAQVNRMIGDLMDLARSTNGKLRIDCKAVSMADLVDDVVLSLAPRALGKQIALTSAIQAGLPPAWADATRVRQILTNLVDNALKFTKTGGRVGLIVAVETGGPKFISVSVEDTGCGLSPEATARVFERLSQEDLSAESNPEGLGLGLFICRDLVTRQGGKVGVSSIEGKGSTFSFTLPLASVNSVAKPGTPGGREPDGSSPQAV